MDLTKDKLDKVKIKAEERITDWIESCQNAGITRLYDQYGTANFKRIEYKKDETQKKEKNAVPSRLRPLKPKKGVEIQRKSLDNRTKELDHSKKDKGDKKSQRKSVKSRQGREDSISRHTMDIQSDSTRKYRDSASIFREMNNRSSHNRSSFKSSVCSMDAISLMCDEPKDDHFGGFHGKLDKFKESDLSFLQFTDTTKTKISKKGFSKKMGTKSRFDPLKLPKRFQIEKSNMNTIAKAEKTFYEYEKSEHFKPGMSKVGGNKDRRKKIKMPVESECISEEDRSSSEGTLEPMRLPRASIQISKDIPLKELNPTCTSPITIQISTETPPPGSLSRPPSTFSQIPVTFTIDTNSVNEYVKRSNSPFAKEPSTTTDETRAKSSFALWSSTTSPLALRPSRSEINTHKPLLRLGLAPSSLGLKRNKSRLSRINLSATPSSVLRTGKSSTLLSRTVSRRFPGGFPSSTNVSVAEDRKAVVLERFRRFTNKFICVSRLLNAVKAKMKMQTREEISSVKKEDEKSHKSNVLDFDVSYFRSATTSYGGLSHRARDALWKMVHQRTERDIRTLKEVMDRLPFFNKYPKSIKADLARMLWYDRFEDQRIIIKQGDIGTRMYFVVSGCVSLQTTDIDPRTGIKHVIHLKDVKSGATFGELALVRDMKRNYTAVCKGDSEFLSLSKDEFNNVLRHQYEEKWQQRHTFIKNQQSFEGASIDQMKSVTDMSDMKSFPDNTVIFGDKTQLTDAVYFISKGKCDMIKKVSLLRTQSPYLRPSLFLSDNKKDHSEFLNKPYGKHTRICRTENHMLTVMSLYPGDYFGVGENLQDTFIITNGKVECLLINSAFFAINLMMDRLDEMKDKNEEKIPSNQNLYLKFEANRKWTEYKKSLVENVVSRKRIPNVTTKEDIPKVLSMAPNIPDDLLWKDKPA
ncbi:uncharacterized protein LOC127716181 [Mytilus californianus]|uniref:uncharacterized protein LOC127716181 n=1 Tax=Mytilus californianus TaxID=6549 RepID=UPI00224758EA|nr:uncharacterized protein LOC127716181 [Mytilus californianus]